MSSRQVVKRFLKARWVLPMCGPPIENGVLEIMSDRIVGVYTPEQAIDRLTGLTYKEAPELVGKSLIGAQANRVAREWQISEELLQDVADALSSESGSAVGTQLNKPVSPPKVRYKVIDYGDAVIMPGLINLHTHVEYTALRGFDTTSDLFGWIPGLMSLVRGWQPQDFRRSAHLGVAELIKTGTTCIVDSSYTGQAAIALAERGMRGIVALELFGLDERRTEEYWQLWLDKRERLLVDIGDRADVDASCAAAHAAISTGLIKISVAPHAPYTVSPALMKKAAAWARSAELPFTMHISESQHENRWTDQGDERVDGFLRGIPGIENQMQSLEWRACKKTPVEILDGHGILDKNLIAAHCVQLHSADVKRLSAKQANVAHCPRSNARLRNGVAPLEDLLGAGVNVGFGTDSAASTDNLDLLEEARSAWRTQRARNTGFDLPSEKAVHMLTAGAARAIGMSDELGTLEPGKLADVAIFNLGNVGEFLLERPFDALLYGQVSLRTVFIGGAEC